MPAITCRIDSAKGTASTCRRLKRHLDGGVDLLLTCDTGVSAHDAVDYAASRGVDTIITDHHALAGRAAGGGRRGQSAAPG